MKRLSPWLAILLLGGLPLTAAAFDYGPNQPLLAADTGGPQLPGAQDHDAASGAIVKPDLTITIDHDHADAANPAPPPVAATPHPGPALHNAGPSASNRARTRTSHPAPAPTASWQSLLPGSIQ